MNYNYQMGQFSPTRGGLDYRTPGMIIPPKSGTTFVKPGQLIQPPIEEKPLMPVPAGGRITQPWAKQSYLATPAPTAPPPISKEGGGTSGQPNGRYEYAGRAIYTQAPFTMEKVKELLPFFGIGLGIYRVLFHR